MDTSARLISDENSAYAGIGAEYAGGHHTVTHSRGEYVRGDIYSNTIESFFGLVKRSINGIYHAVSKEHLHRYLTECEFRWNHRKLEDGARVQALIMATEGKRLVYREPANA